MISLVVTHLSLRTLGARRTETFLKNTRTSFDVISLIVVLTSSDYLPWRYTWHVGGEDFKDDV